MFFFLLFECRFSKIILGVWKRCLLLSSQVSTILRLVVTVATIILNKPIMEYLTTVTTTTRTRVTESSIRRAGKKTKFWGQKRRVLPTITIRNSNSRRLPKKRNRASRRRSPNNDDRRDKFHQFRQLQRASNRLGGSLQRRVKLPHKLNSRQHQRTRKRHR